MFAVNGLRRLLGLGLIGLMASASACHDTDADPKNPREVCAIRVEPPLRS